MHLFTFCRQAACPRRTASIRPPADRAGDGRTTLNRPAGLKSKPESGRNKPSDHTINPSTQCRNKMKSSQAKTLKTHRSRCPHSWDRCSQPVGNPVPNGWESCSQQPGIPFPDTGTSRLTADAEDDLLRTPAFPAGRGRPVSEEVRRSLQWKEKKGLLHRESENRRGR